MRGSLRLEAYRVQSKTLDEFRRRHAGFAAHWDPATFGQPWLDDYQAAKPERRPDLDLKRAPLPDGLAAPLALGFYWVRFLPRAGATRTLFLPGFKTDQTVDLPIHATDAAGDTEWHVPLRYPYLDDEPLSTATAWTSPDHHLARLEFDLHGTRGSAGGVIMAEGCDGAAAAP